MYGPLLVAAREVNCREPRPLVEVVAAAAAASPAWTLFVLGTAAVPLSVVSVLFLPSNVLTVNKTK